ncbi:putative glycosyl transferase [Lactococcus raffinolactis 4877]|nr:putative glycosyl transferase [Lactococcus raffinolactis 4877]
MRILHYGLGYQPERTGGLVKYATDLMEEQVRQEHEVAYLFPGRINIFNSSTKIKKSKMRITGVTSFEIINSLPLAVFGGIKNPEKFQSKVDHSIYSNLLDDFRPDVIHVHSLMGIHKEFFEVCKEKKIKIIYTSHDYFGLSPNPTFYFNGKSWDEENNLNFWLNVSQGALGLKKIKMLQIPFYSNIRDIIKKFKKSSFQKEKYFKTMENDDFSIDYQESFKELIDYYQGIFKLVTFFHFNSNISQKVFERNLVEQSFNYEVLPISNSTISGGTKHIKLDMAKVKKITYIGQYAEFKGLYDFLSLATSFKDSNIIFEIFGEDIDVELPQNVSNRKRFSPDNIENIFKNIQLLVIPSRWKETFGFLSLEALSHEVPIIVSSSIGSKDIIPDICVFESQSLTTTMMDWVSKDKKIEFVINLKGMEDHNREIINLYERII